MTRSIKPVAASIGGVEIVVTPAARRRVRRAARMGMVAVGYAAGLTAAVLLCAAAVQSALLGPIVLCGSVACIVTLRCMKNRGGNRYAREK